MAVRLMLRCWTLSLFVITVLGCNASTNTDPNERTGSEIDRSVEPIAAARASMKRGEFEDANKWIQQALTANAKDAEALELAGDLAGRDGDATRSIAFYQLAIQSADPPSKDLYDRLGQQYVNAGRPFETIDLLQVAVKQYADDPLLRQKLVGMQAALGMQQEAKEHLQWLVQRGHGNLNFLLILSDLNRPQTVESICQRALDNYPQDQRPQFSMAMLPAYHSRWSEVAKKLKPVVKGYPNFVSAQAFYGRAVVELNDAVAISQWSKSLPDAIQKHPQYWLAVGIWAEQQGQEPEAAKAYWQAAKLDVNDSEPLSRLSAILIRMGQVDEAKQASQRAAMLASLRDEVDAILSWRRNSQTDAVKIAQSLDALGRRWEATTWLQTAFPMTQNPEPQLPQIYQSIRSKLTGSTPWQTPESVVASKLDLTDFPDFRWQKSVAPKTTSSVALADVDIRFGDQATARHLQHECKLGKPTGDEAGLAIFQSGAGGAGVIDIDLDGSPDVYLTSMDGQPKKNDSSSNRLFRNLAGRFQEITTLAGVGDLGFAQGLAVGDYNADGFPDLYVANIGQNKLFRNNGDGTFTNATDQAGLSGELWTTSTAIVDIDGDGNADIYEVGYCAGDRPFNQPCIDDELQEPRSCSPGAFDAQQDRIWQGTGQGTFVDVTNQWLGNHEAGRGFGIILGHLDQNPGIDIFVANDMTANHLWCAAPNESTFQMSEQATLRGLALNERSLSQASMGIAAGDPDQDGDVDFLVTHFSGDYNTYYEQVGDALWADKSKRVGLAEPSDRMLAYGTQWIDADNDGSLELFIANGDIDDFTHQDRLFRQPSQFFRRRADGRWIESDGAKLGDYFAKPHLGRSVATLDANRDGRMDLLVTHLFEPVSLLINETITDNGQVRFVLRATSSHRDAIGAEVRFLIDGTEQRKQLLAGDGFQCANERCISFGVGTATNLENLIVRWPGGSSEAFGTVETGGEYLLIEGTGSAFAHVP
ncbi:MAG: FG-GAP-like repeat-containing protein [Rubripirellula sp.]|nr:FG-GAP-like repeat-containing protein [Rubripirellula sp.]